ncbi:MAG: DUF3299 domain-containing protein [Calditrichota bacterium]
MKIFRILAFALIAIFSVLTFASNDDDKRVSWEVLTNIKMIEQDSRYIPEFSQEVLDLDGKTIELKGFMMPLDNAETQNEFVLSGSPLGSCFFCIPGGPEAMVEVFSASGVKFSYDSVVISGTLELVDDDPMGMFYRMRDATQVD